MRRHPFALTFAFALLISLGVPRNAAAEPYNCGSDSSPYSGDCMTSYTASGDIGVYSTSTAGYAVYATDTTTGTGVFGNTTSGVWTSTTISAGVIGQNEGGGIGYLGILTSPGSYYVGAAGTLANENIPCFTGCLTTIA
jgi:hypothetical protein